MPNSPALELLIISVSSLLLLKRKRGDVVMWWRGVVW
jgi:hypothetical protein